MIPSLENKDAINALLKDTIHQLQGKIKVDGVWYKPAKRSAPRKLVLKCTRCRGEFKRDKMEWIQNGNQEKPYCIKCYDNYEGRGEYLKK